MSFCPNCGAVVVAENVKFCPSCGKSMSVVAEATQPNRELLKTQYTISEYKNFRKAGYILFVLGIVVTWLGLESSPWQPNRDTIITLGVLVIGAGLLLSYYFDKKIREELCL